MRNGHFAVALCSGLVLAVASWPGAALGQHRGLGDLGATGGASRSSGETVDVELILAVDVSWSMDSGEQRIQRDGYVSAFRSAEVQKAILGGGHGRIAVTYIEWAGVLSQSVVVPWTLVDSKEAAEAFAYRLASEEPERERRTSISAGLDFAAAMFDDNGFAGLRRVIDMSGDGPNNQGRSVEDARDAAVARGITINGLPLMTSGLREGYPSWGNIQNLDAYYEACVIGGAGAFMIPVNDWVQFPEAVRRKLILELAGTWPLPKPDTAPVVRTQGGEAVDCFVGERMWQQRQDRWMDPR